MFEQRQYQWRWARVEEDLKMFMKQSRQYQRSGEKTSSGEDGTTEGNFQKTGR